MSDEVKTARRFRIALTLAVVGLVVAFFALGGREHLSVDALRARLEGLGALGPIVFVLTFTFVQPLGISGHVFTIVASLLWSFEQAFVLSLLGGTAGQCVAFLFYRYVAYDFARARIPERVRALEAHVVKRPFLTVAGLRLVSFTWPLMPMLLGVSAIRFLPMLLGTVAGLAPGIALDLYLGATFFESFFG